MVRRAAWACSAGLVLSAAYEPIALPYVLPFAVAALLVCLHGVPVRRAWIPGLAFGVGFYFTHIYWMKQSLGVAPWIALAGIEALFYALFAVAAVALMQRRWWPLWVAAAWVTAEVWRSQWPFSGMPWGRLAFAVVDTPAQWALPYVGMVGVSFLLALLAACLAWLVLTRGARWHGVVGTVIVAGVLLAPALHHYTLPTVAHRVVAAVQGDVPGPGNDILFDFRQVTRNHIDATVQLAARVERGEVPAPDLVVWPENSTAVDPFADQQTRAGIEEAVAAVGVPVMVGAIVDDGADYVLNQGVVWNPGTGPGDRYTKRHPVPYGEYIPFRRYLDLNFGQLSQITRDMRAGTRSTPLDVAGVRVADAICFDVAYDDGIRDQMLAGAQLLTVQTSNATFIFTHQTDQQFAMTRLRAVETGKWTVVASTNGISGIIDPTGRVVDTADKRTTAVLLDRVGLTDGVTPGIRAGLLIGRTCIAATLLGLVLVTLAYRRSRKVRTPHLRDEEGST